MKRSLLVILVFVAVLSVSAQTGGTFDLSQNVVAGGGGANSTGGVFSLSGSAGQPAAGTVSNNGTFQFRGGFWVQSLGPTSAVVSLAGRVTNAGGQGIQGARLKLTAPDGSVRMAISSSFGYYTFDGVQAGNTYILDITMKRTTFAEPTRVILVQDDIANLDFVADFED